MMLSKYLPAIKRFGSCFVYWSGLYSIYRRCCAKNRITFIFYHDIADSSPLPETSLFIETSYFWEHIHKLSKIYSIIGMSDFLSGEPLPNYPLIITFDGYSRMYLKLAKELSHRNIKALFYLLTEPISVSRPHWRQQLYFIFRSLKNVEVEVEFNNKVFSSNLTDEPAGNIKLARKLAQCMECLDDKSAIVYQIAKRYGVDLEDFDTMYRPLRPDEVTELSIIPGIEIGSHSYTHPVLEDLSPEHILYEFETSKKLLEQWTNKPIVHYAYPSGFVNERMPELLQQAGYLTASTIVPKLHKPYSPDEWPYLIPRYAVSNVPFPVLAGQLTGWEKAFDAILSKIVVVIHFLRKLKGKFNES